MNAPRHGPQPRPESTQTFFPSPRPVSATRGAAAAQAAAVRRPQRRRARAGGAWIRPWRVKICRMHRLLILSRHARDYHRLVDAARLPDLEVTSTSDPADAAPRAGDYDLAFGEPSLLRQVLPSMASLRWTQATWAGVEPLLDPALRRDYILTNARGVFGGLMSEYVFAYLLAHERRLFEKHASQAAGRWDTAPPGTLRGKQLGLLGVGTIGAALARTAKHFGMTRQGLYARQRGQPRRRRLVSRIDGRPARGVRVGSRLPGEHHAGDEGDAPCSSTRSSCARCRRARCSSIRAAAASSTNRRSRRRCRKGRLAGAVLDVFQEEPLPPDHVFWRTPNLLITSHTAALSDPAGHRAGLHRQLSTAAARRAAAPPGRFRARILTAATVTLRSRPRRKTQRPRITQRPQRRAP